MEKFLAELQRQRNCAEEIATKVENGETYMGEIKGYFPSLNQTILKIFEITKNGTIPVSINQEFVLQVLNDIVYGMEKEDPIFLADVLRYGLIEIFDYIGAELRGKDQNE